MCSFRCKNDHILVDHSDRGRTPFTRYYSYLMARSVASSIWQKCFQSDPLNPDAGRRYRAECLAHGGGKPSHELVSDFLGREVNPEDLADAVVAEIDSKTDVLKAMMAAKSGA